MASIASLTVAFPKRRMTIAVAAARIVGPVIPQRWRSAFINALAEWSCKGLRFTEQHAPDCTWRQRFRVWVDGQEVENVYEADTEASWVLARRADGVFVVHRGSLRISAVGRP